MSHNAKGKCFGVRPFPRRTRAGALLSRPKKDFL